MQNELREARAEALVLQKHLETASIASDQTRKELEQATGMHEEQLARLRERCDAAEQELERSRTEFVNEYKKLSQREGQLRDQVEEHNAAVRELQGRLNNEVKQFTILQAQHQADIETLKHDFAEDSNQLHELLQTNQALLTAERSQTAILSDNLHRIQKDKKQLEQELKDAQGRINIHEEMISQLETRLQQLIMNRSTTPQGFPNSPKKPTRSDETEATLSSSKAVEITLEEWTPEVSDKPKSMQMDDDLLKPPSCLTGWGSSFSQQHPRGIVARSTPNLRGFGHDGQRSSEGTAGWNWGLWPFSTGR